MAGDFKMLTNELFEIMKEPIFSERFDEPELVDNGIKSSLEPFEPFTTVGKNCFSLSNLVNGLIYFQTYI